MAQLSFVRFFMESMLKSILDLLLVLK